MFKAHRMTVLSLAAMAMLASVGSARAADLEQVRRLLGENQADKAIELLSADVAENPANLAARVLLAEAYDKSGKAEDAVKTWEEVIRLSKDEDLQQTARKNISRLRRADLDRMDRDLPYTDRDDPFKIPMPEVDWEKLAVVEDTKYLPPIFPPPFAFEVPPFVHETEHFTVYSTNELLSKTVGERAEIYLEFMIEKLFGGRSWPARIPILIYRDNADYNSHGGPQGSGGVTFSHPLSGITQAVILFQLKPDFSQRRGGRGGGAGPGKEIWKYGIESVLPHELTHAVLNEFFAGKNPPRWLHEAIAGRFEQTRDHYGEAARLARKVMAGEYFRMGDLFEQPEYPERIELFYEQSAAVVLYLFETGPEAMHAFLAELAAGRDHDAACAAALGTPEEGAVEEFERRWVDWMSRRYRKDLKAESDKPITSTVEPSRATAFVPWANELETVNTLEKWREADLSSLSPFKAVGGGEKEWSAGEGKLSYSPKEEGRAGFLGIRMNESAPVALTCTVRYLGSPGGGGNLFGFVQLDAEGFDTPIQVLAPLRDSSAHQLACVWADDLALYVDGTCMGRYPARAVTGNERDIDFPLAFVAHGPVEIQDLKIAAISAFSDKPVAAAAPPTTAATPREGGPAQPRARTRSRTRNPKP